MAALTACFEDAGFEDVVTYIQSGNVVFRAAGATRTALVPRIEELLAGEFNYPARIVLRSRSQMAAIVERAPVGFGEGAGYQYDVIFLKEPLRAEAALRDVPRRPDVDDVRPGPGVLYVARPRNELSRSRLTKVVGTPIYQNMTIRSWSTTSRLLALMGRPGEKGKGAGPASAS
jgi:uncharacterized protein (DUF1697 family)